MKVQQRPRALTLAGLRVRKLELSTGGIILFALRPLSSNSVVFYFVSTPSQGIKNHLRQNKIIGKVDCCMANRYLDPAGLGSHPKLSISNG